MATLAGSGANTSGKETSFTVFGITIGTVAAFIPVGSISGAVDAMDGTGGNTNGVVTAYTVFGTTTVVDVEL